MKPFAALFRKDLLLIAKAESQAVSTVMFALVLAAVSAFSFRILGFRAEDTRALVPGILWMIFLFVSAVALNQSMALEREQRAMRGLLLSGVDPFLVFQSKSAAIGLFLFVVQAIVIAGVGLLLGVDYGPAAPGLFLVAALVVFGISSLGTVLSAMAAASRARELLLPLLLFPLALPALIAAVAVGRSVLEMGQIDWSDLWLLFLAGWAVINWTLGWLLFGFIEGD